MVITNPVEINLNKNYTLGKKSFYTHERQSKKDLYIVIKGPKRKEKRRIYKLNKLGTLTKSIWSSI